MAARVRSPLRRPSIAIALAVALLAACSSDGESTTTTANTPETTPRSSDSPPTSDATSSSATTSAEQTTTTTTVGSAPNTTTAIPPLRTCAAPTNTTPVQATPVGNDRDWDIVSFDGTVIRAHWFPNNDLGEEGAAPTVLMGPGWGSAGDVDDADGDGDSARFGRIDIAALRASGYNVLTWDPRGFGESGGVATINSADAEGRDVQQLLDWVATQPAAMLDAERDPRVGMAGGSYGGSIQLIAAAIDCRIDAIAPILAWSSLDDSLNKSGIAKQGWTTLLATMALTGRVDPVIDEARDLGASTGRIGDDAESWLIERGPGALVSAITAPTLLIQGTVDTLFTLQEAITNHQRLLDAGTPTAMLWYCGGHGMCLTDPGDFARVQVATINWLDRYVAGDLDAESVAGFEFVDQNGQGHRAERYAPDRDEPMTASGTGSLALTADGGAGPITPADGGLIGAFIGQITPGRATNAINVTIPARANGGIAVGAPQVTMTYTGRPGVDDRPMRVFAQLIDDATGLVIGNQITPIEVVLDGEQHSVTASLEAIAHAAPAGSTMTLQIVAVTSAYARPQLGGSITDADVSVVVPVQDALTPV